MSTATARYEIPIADSIDRAVMSNDEFDARYEQVMGAFQKNKFVRQNHIFVPENQLYGARVTCFKTLLYHAAKNRDDLSEQGRENLIIGRTKPARFWIQGPASTAVSLDLTLFPGTEDEPNTYHAITKFWKDGKSEEICKIPLDRRKHVYAARARDTAYDAYRALGLPAIDWRKDV
jgi:hypothetical protein